ncbi:hypothetical protein [Aquicella lusitana]|uniref:Pilin accessory protein (PilO) n=1 Tax=Aquicella lusitana TaxID=254246 RepID=A0A370GS55_9COXI|nr:hypothetical protein [Aquicella lusitana]RDI46532.1 hypothetical protein C8D86_10556 [Aquicella lusitana]VVC74196.1 hypothetical protein AQULUS_19610 [Aquicella lusitana]
MAYITREDGEHFVIPSYRDVLAVKNKSALKKEILLLSQNYGEYITLQRKGSNQYEVAFSPDTGYLLGESIWHHFKRPVDMIYCEAIPNTTEAILVIVKSGSVYLDGSFPLDSIPEELVIFLTQQNNFEIYIYGDVPISQMPEEGKFSFDASSVKTFTVLDKPVFPTLPLLKIYQLQLVDTVLKAHGIGVFPIKQVMLVIVVLGLLWMAWSFLSARREAMPEFLAEPNPYQLYNTTLATPAPDEEMKKFLDGVRLLFTMPGWLPYTIDYSNRNLSALVQSTGSKTEQLFEWASQNKAVINIKSTGIFVALTLTMPNRPVPNRIYPIKQVIGELVDRLADVYPGNNLRLGNFLNKGVFTQVTMTLTLTDVTPVILALIGEQLKGLPLVLSKVNLTVTNGNFSGSITIEALGS